MIAALPFQLKCKWYNWGQHPSDFQRNVHVRALHHADGDVWVLLLSIVSTLSTTVAIERFPKGSGNAWTLSRSMRQWRVDTGTVHCRSEPGVVCLPTPHRYK